MYYYVALQTRSQAFLLERRMKDQSVNCELTYMPRSIMADLCNMGVKFDENEFQRAILVIKTSGLPGCRLYKELIFPNYSQYLEVKP